MALIKREILTWREVVYTEGLLDKACFAKKDAFQNTDFSRLKCQLKKKRWHSMFVKLLQVSADEGMGKNKVNLSSFQTQKLF